MINRSILDRFAAKEQGCRTMSQLLDFDHFNDYKDTLGWLRAQNSDEYPVKEAIDCLEVSHWIWEKAGALPPVRGWKDV